MTALYAAPTILKRATSVPREIREWTPRSLLGASIFRAIPHLPADLAAELLERIQSAAIIESCLRIKVFRGEGGAPWYAIGRRPITEDYGVVSRRVVTTAGMNAVVDAYQNTVELENFKYHGLGTGSTAEASSDTALVTELTTEYTGNVRATGTTTEGASANIYETVATNTLDGTPGAALREHGVFSANSAGTLLDRSVFSSITLSSGDGLQSTYDITFTAGG